MKKMECFLNIAFEIAKLSPDKDTQVGCVLVNSDFEIVSTGYNGYVRNANENNLPNCRDQLCSSGYHKYNYIIHAEHNAILNCARNGVSTKGLTAFITHSPCQHCIRYLLQVGVNSVFFKIKHASFCDTLKQKDYNVYEVRHLSNYTQLIIEQN